MRDLAEKKLSDMAPRMGRPPLGLKPTLVRLSPDALARIDEIAGANRRAEFIREAVERELARREKG